MTAKSSSEAAAPSQPPVVIKKYANRRLYNTSSSSYVTLEELARLLRDGKEFVVFDAKSSEEITRSVLTQIILEEDSKGRNLLPVPFLRQLIGFYDDSSYAMLPRYLEASMDHFMQNQEQMQRYFEGTMGRFFPVNQLNEMTRQNMALFQQATSIFNPFPGSAVNTAKSGGDADNKALYEQQLSEIAALQEQVEALKAQLDARNDNAGTVGTPKQARGGER